MERLPISTVFIAHGQGELEGRDDAVQAQFFRQNNLPALAFDHAQILADFFNESPAGLL